MITEFLKRAEPWSYPVPHYEEHAQVWHARRYVAWLLKAGAEPRFGALLNSGTQAQARWTLLLEEQGVEVTRIHSHLDRPLPKALTDHHGDHFNRRLFLLDGLDALSENSSDEELEAFWCTLDGQRSQIKQLATWVTLNITQAKTLIFALKFAPRLMKELDRTCWIWSATERSKSCTDFKLNYETIPYSQRFIFENFIRATCFDQVIPHLQLGRIFRSGYMKPPSKAHAHWHWAYQLWRGEVRDSTATRFGQQGVTEALPQSLSPHDALWALKGRIEAATPARIEQWTERALHSDQAWQVSEQALLPTDDLLIHQLAQWARSEDQESIQLSLKELEWVEKKLFELIQDQTLFSAQLVDWLTRAYAQLESLAGCIRVNQMLAQSLYPWPELRFMAYERLIELDLFIQDYQGARAKLKELEQIELCLHSPAYEARFLLAKAQCVGALDTSKGEEISTQAQAVNQRFAFIKPNR